MPMEYITLRDQGAQRHGATTALSPGDLALRLLDSAGDAPLRVMIHGFKYQPGHPRHCPHRSLFALSPASGDPRIAGWPRRLGIGRGNRAEPLGLSFGWPARGSLWRAYRNAGQAGIALAGLLDALHRHDPRLDIGLIGHSLGARVALQALALSAPGTVRRAVLLSAAEFGATARAALTTRGARTCDVLAVTSGENDLFDALLEALLRAPEPRDRIFGQATKGLEALPNLAHLQLDHAESLRRLRSGGFAIAPPARAICHWSSYLRPGVFPLYRAFLAGRVTPAELRALLPARTDPRWSRLRATLALPHPGPPPRAMGT